MGQELGGGEYWENVALRAKIDGFGTRYNGNEIAQIKVTVLQARKKSTTHVPSKPSNNPF